MAYITLNELKEILPIILERWIDEDYESWEWIFQEIEQKCHIGTKRKGKKWKKYIEDDVYQMKSMVDTHSVVLSAHRNDINELTKKLDELKKYATDDLSPRINRMNNDITAAKSMAQIAKNRTEVKYNEIGIDKRPPHISYTLWSSAKHMLSVFEQRGATKEELEQLDFLFSKYILDVDICDSQWRKEHKQELNNLAGAKDCKTCKTCKYYTNREAGNGMHNSELDCYSIIGPCVNYSKWEKKEMPVIKKIEIDCQTCKHVDKYPNCPDCGNNYSAWEAKDDGS